MYHAVQSLGQTPPPPPPRKKEQNKTKQTKNTIGSGKNQISFEMESASIKEIKRRVC